MQKKEVVSDVEALCRHLFPDGTADCFMPWNNLFRLS